MAENRGQTLEAPPLQIYYMKLTTDQVHSRLGKLKRGQVVSVPQDLATRLLMAGVAEQVSSGEYEEQTQRKQDKMSARQQAFANLNQAHALWDVSTHRDVLTASEAGLRAAYEAGMPLVNLEHLVDEEGEPLPQDASIDEILEARQNTHTDAQFPFQAHDRSSVMGGGSPYTVQGGPQPLAPRYRERAQQIHDAETFANQPEALAQENEANRAEHRPPPGRAGRAARRLTGSQEASTGGAPPPPPPPRRQQGISPEGDAAAREHGVPPPQLVDPNQTQNS